MKRGIKFRGLRTDGKEWVYGGYFQHTPDQDGVRYYIFDFNEGAVEVIPESVGQFTGLKDLKGNEIYEGDKTSYGVIMWNSEKSLFAEHFYQEVIQKWSVSSYPISVDRMEIIGNIHENSELLNTNP